MWKTSIAIASAVASEIDAAIWAFIFNPAIEVNKTTSGSAAHSVESHQ